MRRVSLAVAAIAIITFRHNYAAVPSYDIEQAVAIAEAHNPEILVARKKMEAAQGGIVEARSGFLPSVVSTGLLRKREAQRETRLRNEDYGATVRVVQNLYTGGATSSHLAIAQLNLQIQRLELEATASRVAMEVRLAFEELLLNRAKIRVYEDSVAVLQQEVQSQQERLSAGMVGQLNVRRAEVAVAQEEPNLIDAQAQLKNSYVRLAELLAMESRSNTAAFQAIGQLRYLPQQRDLAGCLARADADRPEIKSRRKQIEIEDRQADLDRSALRPQIEAFTGYEVYNERDPLVGPEFNYGYVVGLNARWNIFDGFATKGRLQATHARREAAVQALKATQLSIASEVRSAFLDIQQADRVLESETKNVQRADESLNLAKSNLAAGLGTQLDILQAASDVTRTQTTRLNAIYQHNAAVARLARACGSSPGELALQGSGSQNPVTEAATGIADLAKPPATLTQR